MSVPAVHWHEGMFLRPHHFQAAERYLADQSRRAGRLDVHHNWGLRAIDLDTDALRNYRFEVHRLEARLRDGTLVVAARDQNPLAGLDLRPAMAELPPGGTVDVLVGVPVMQLGRPNAAADGPDARYHTDTPREPVPDENTGQNPRLVQFRRLNLRLFAGTQDVSGYETIAVARLERSAQATAPPQLHPWFIPPVLACDAWPGLGDGVVGQVYNRIGTMVKQIAQRTREQRITFDSNAPEDRKLFERLRALNEGYATLGVVARAAGVHPFDAYLELCRLAGRLAVFGKAMAVPDEDMPPYDHDDLGRCFFAVKRLIDALLTHDFDQGYDARPFVGAGLRLRVGIEPAWLAPAAQVLVGVESPLPPAEAVRLLAGRLNMKIGSFERVDEIFRLGLRGLDFVPVPNPPRVLPASPRLTYFQVNREGSRDEWEHVAQTYTLAVR
ncbi:MAG TPA: type VI secretion system baseplate subunit TssK, partial [Urbifossiella sp.]|nr:type VI secretion system baseplate subunit TssK [Urbifossiella sp.]